MVRRWISGGAAALVLALAGSVVAAERHSQTVELALAPGASEGSEVEYMIHMKAGDRLSYAWRVEGGAPPAEFYADFRGQSARQNAAKRPLQTRSYRKGVGTSATGKLTAPFAGVHGWLFKNDSAKPVRVKLTLSGRYEPLSLREAMGLDGPEFVPFGPAGWPDRYGPAQGR